MIQNQDYLFKAIAGYFVNFYFNTLYKAAKSASINSRDGLSITDTYRAKVSSYIQAIKGAESAYKTLVTKLHEYCVKISSRFNSMSSSKFINTLVDGFVPVDYIDSLSITDKDEVFNVIIIDLAATLGSVCTKPEYLRKIIDQHEESRNITCEMIFKEAIRALDNKKDMMMNKFIREISQAKDYISSDAANQLRQILDEKEEIIESRNEEIAELRHQVDELREKEIKLRRMVELLQKSRIVIQQQQNSDIITPSDTKPLPLTSNNLVEHTLHQDKKSTHKRSNIMNSVVESQKQKNTTVINSPRKELPTTPVVPVKGPPSIEPLRGSCKPQSVSQESSESDSESEETNSESLTSGKKSIIDNIDGLILTK